MKNTMRDIQTVLNEINAKMVDAAIRGRVADYIPELAKIDPNQFGIAVATADGAVHFAGHARTQFSIQSISKVFMLAIALGRRGEQLFERVGREPSGEPFNSILQLEREMGIPRNPFINAGALVVTDTILEGHEPREVLGELLRFMRELSGDDDIFINENVARSEQEFGNRNLALTHFMAAHGNIKNEPTKTAGTYFHQCAIEMDCVQMAKAGRFLVGSDDMPRAISLDRVRRINALMLTCGHYDGSGDFAYRVGLPGKSGVGGGILAVVPNIASICVWSPGLNDNGNSLLAAQAIEQLAHAMDWSVFGWGYRDQQNRPLGRPSS